MRASSGPLRRLGVAPALVAQIVAGPRQVAQVAAGLKGLQRLGIVPLPLASTAYPDRLQALNEPPLVVYVHGQWPIPQPLALIIQAGDLEPRVAQTWTELASALQAHIGLATLAAGSEVQLALPRLLGLPYGLMLARQRLPQAVWKQVTAGTCTLISTSPPTAQPDPMATQATSRTLVALADALVALLPLPAETDDLVATARSVGVPMFAISATPRTPMPPHMRRLRAGKKSVQTLAATLGVHLDGAATVQQERLF